MLPIFPTRAAFCYNIQDVWNPVTSLEKYQWRSERLFEKAAGIIHKRFRTEEHSIGVPTGEIRNIAKRIGKSNELAFELWNTVYHEVRLLAVLIFDRKDITHSDIEKLMGEVASWDLCDHLCKTLIAKMKDYEKFIYKWITSTHIFCVKTTTTLRIIILPITKPMESEAIQ